MTPFVKAAYVAWKDKGHGLYLGISSSPTVERVENSWGYRAVESATQEREAAEGPDQTVAVGSIFGVWDLGEKLSLLACVDRAFDGIPNAGSIPYLGLAADTGFDLALAGLDYRTHRMVSVIPNVEYVAYRETNGRPAPEDDLIARLTLSVWF